MSPHADLPSDVDVEALLAWVRANDPHEESTVRSILQGYAAHARDQPGGLSLSAGQRAFLALDIEKRYTAIQALAMARQGFRDGDRSAVSTVASLIESLGDDAPALLVTAGARDVEALLAWARA